MLNSLRVALAAFVMLVSGTVFAASVWVPTDGDINASNVFSTPGVTFGIFDNDTGVTGSALLTFTGGDIIRFSGTLITNTSTSSSATLTGNQAFMVAALLDGSWRADDSFFKDTSTAYLITFNNGKSAANLYLNDVTPVPEPSALLMMALGIAGLLALRRRSI